MLCCLYAHMNANVELHNYAGMCSLAASDVNNLHTLTHFFIPTTAVFSPAIHSQPQLFLFHTLKRVLVLFTCLIPGFIIPLFSQRLKVNNGHSAKHTKSSFGIYLVNVTEVWLRTNLKPLFLYLSSLLCVCLWCKLSEVCLSEYVGQAAWNDALLSRFHVCQTVVSDICDTTQPSPAWGEKGLTETSADERSLKFNPTDTADTDAD